MIRVQVHQIYLGTRVGDCQLNEKWVTSGYMDRFNVNWVKMKQMLPRFQISGAYGSERMKFDEVRMSDETSVRYVGIHT